MYAVLLSGNPGSRVKHSAQRHSSSSSSTGSIIRRPLLLNGSWPALNGAHSREATAFRVFVNDCVSLEEQLTAVSTVDTQ